MILHTAQLLNSLSIYNSAMIKASITELKIQGSKLKLTSVADFCCWFSINEKSLV